MKTEDQAVRVVRSTDFKETNFGVRSKEDLVHIFNVLRNKMYSNKILAIIREYSTNAMDAHIESGKPELPINVTLPTRESPYLKIRDFGSGLSDDDIRNVYAMYGASTKRDSNDFNGQLGFGSKSAFSYTDSFTISSFFDGKKTDYEAFIDESGLGSIAELVSSESDEPSGVLITVPVKHSDVDSFQTTAFKFYKYFSVTPVFLGGKRINVEKPNYSYSGDNWGYCDHREWGERTKAIMGNVAYPIDVSAIDNAPVSISNSARAIIRSNKFDLYFEIGDLSIAATREGLEYDKKTVTNIAKKLSSVEDSIRNKHKDELDKVKDIVAARQLFKTIRNDHLFNILNIGHVEWNGEKIRSSKFSIPADSVKDGFFAHAVHLDSGLSSGIGKQTLASANLGLRYSNFEVTTDGLICIVDEKCDKWQRRAATMLKEKNIRTTVVFKFPNRKALTAFKKATQIPQKYFVNLSKYEPAPLNKKSYDYRRGSSKNIFRLKKPAYSCGALSDNWNEADIDLSRARGVYVPIYGFKWGDIKPNELNKILLSLKLLNSKLQDTDLIGIKAGYLEKLEKKKKFPNKKWISLPELISNELNNFAADEAAEFCVVKDQLEFINLNLNVFEIAENIPLALEGLKSLLGREGILTTAKNKDGEGKLRAAQYLSGVVANTNLDKKFNTNKLFPKYAKLLKDVDSELSAKYPLLKYAHFPRYGANKGKIVNEFTDYIKIMDVINQNKENEK